MQELKYKRQTEINYLYELLKEVLKEEGYNICNWEYADKGYQAFEILFKNGITDNEKLMIRLSYSYFES